MYRAILPEGSVDSDRYEHVEHGVELYDEDDDLLAFVPYANLEALLTQVAFETEEPSMM
jgi:hypothetical protein